MKFLTPELDSFYHSQADDILGEFMMFDAAQDKIADEVTLPSTEVDKVGEGESAEINREALQSLEEALKLAESIHQLSEGWEFSGGVRSPVERSTPKLSFSIDNAEKKWKRELKVDEFYKSLHRSYHVYRSLEVGSEAYDRYRRDLMDQVNLAKRLFKVNPLEHLPAFVGASHNNAFSEKLTTMSLVSWQLEVVENRRRLEALGEGLQDVKNKMATLEAHQEVYGEIQGELSWLVNDINHRIETLLENPALAFLSDWAGLNGYIQREKAREDENGQKRQVDSRDKQKQEKMDEMKSEAEAIERELHESLGQWMDVQGDLKRLSELAKEINDSKSYVAVNLRHLENYHFDLKMQQIQIASFYASPNATLKAMSELYTDLEKKTTRKQKETNAWKAKKTELEGELEAAKNKPEKEQDTIKQHQLTADIESAKLKLFELEGGQKGLETNKASLERQQARVARQKPVREKIHAIKMEANRIIWWPSRPKPKQLPDKTEAEIEEALPDQGVFDENYQLQLQRILEKTHGYHAVIGSATQLVSSVISNMGHEAGMSGLTPEIHSKINATLNCAGRLFDIGVTIANISASVERAMEGGFGAQNILTTIISPSIGIFNMLLSLVRGLNPLPDSNQEQLKAQAKAMAERFQVLGAGIDQLGEMTQLSLKQSQVIITMLSDGFYYLSLNEASRGVSQENRLKEIKRNLDSLSLSEINKPYNDLMVELQSVDKRLKEGVKFADAASVLLDSIKDFNSTLKRNNTAEVRRAYKPYRESQPELLWTHSGTLIGEHVKNAGIPKNPKQQQTLGTMLKLNRVLLSQAWRTLPQLEVPANDSYTAHFTRLAAKTALSRSRALLGTYQDLREVRVFEQAYLSVIHAVNRSDQLLRQYTIRWLAPEGDTPMARCFDEQHPHTYADTQVILRGEDGLRVALSQENADTIKQYHRVWRDGAKHRYEQVVSHHESSTVDHYYDQYSKLSGLPTFSVKAKRSTLPLSEADKLAKAEVGEQLSRFFDLRDRTPAHFAHFSEKEETEWFDGFDDWCKGGQPFYQAHFFNAPFKYVYKLGTMEYRQEVLLHAGEVRSNVGNIHYSRIPLSTVIERRVGEREQAASEQNLSFIQSTIAALKPWVIQGHVRSLALTQLERQSNKEVLAKDIFIAFVLGLMKPRDARYQAVFEQFKEGVSSLQNRRDDFEAAMSAPDMMDYCAAHIEQYLHEVSTDQLPMSLTLIRLVLAKADGLDASKIGYYTGNEVGGIESIPELYRRRLDFYAPWFNPFIVDVLRDRSLGEVYYNAHVKRLSRTYGDCVRYLESGDQGELTEAECLNLTEGGLLVYPEAKPTFDYFPVLVPLVVSKSNMAGYVTRYLASLYDRKPGHGMHPDAKFTFRYVLENEAQSASITIGLHLYVGSLTHALKKITTKGSIPYLVINKQSLQYYVRQHGTVTLGETFEFDPSKSSHVHALNMLLMHLQSPLMQGYLLGKESYWPVEKVYGISRYVKCKDGQGRKFDDLFEMWEDYARDGYQQRNPITLTNPVRLPIPKIKHFPGLYQARISAGNTFVYSHHDYNASLASLWSQPTLHQATHLHQNIRPISDEVFNAMESPHKRDLVMVKTNVELEAGQTSLRKAVYRLMGLFALTGEMDQHTDILNQLFLSDLLNVMNHHGSDQELATFASVMSNFVKANGQANVLLAMLIDYHESVIARATSKPLMTLTAQVNALSVLRVSQGIFAQRKAESVASTQFSADLPKGTRNEC